MKRKDLLTQLKSKSLPELQKLLAEKRESLRKLRFDLYQGKVKNIKEIDFTKKMIARILTLINQKRKNI